MTKGFVSIHRYAATVPERGFVPSRRAIGIAALALGFALFALRIHQINTPARMELGEQAQKLAYARNLAARLHAYSEKYGRPVFMMAGVPHPFPAESLEYAQLWHELASERVVYRYGDEGYTVGIWEPTRWVNGVAVRAQMMGVSGEWPTEAALYAKTRWMAYHPGPYR